MQNPDGHPIDSPDQLSKVAATQGWPARTLRTLGTTTDLMTASRLLGIGRTKAYALVRSGNFPVQVVRIGRTYRVPVAPLLELLGVSPEDARH